MGRETISIEDNIKPAQESLNDFPIKERFLIINMRKKITRYGKPYYFLNLKDKKGSINAKRFTSGELEFESLKAIYLVGNFVEIEGIYQSEWDSLNINNENLIENFIEKSPFEVQNRSLEYILKKELAPLKELIKFGTTIQRKSYINDVIKPIFDNLGSRKIKKLKKSFEIEIKGWPKEKREEFYYDYAKTFERYENMQPSKWKKLGSNLFKLLSVLR